MGLDRVEAHKKFGDVGRHLQPPTGVNISKYNLQRVQAVRVRMVSDRYATNHDIQNICINISKPEPISKAPTPTFIDSKYLSRLLRKCRQGK